MAEGSGPIRVVVSVDDAHTDSLDQVAEKLEAAGMQVEQAMPTLGTVVGSVHSDQLAKLSQVQGVAHVERSSTFRIPPPDAEVQ